MLERLHIENIAVIERCDIAFNEGMTVLTGETGAGKSIVIDSLGLILGERASRELVRTGAQGAFVSALFSQLSKQAVAGIGQVGISPDENGQLLVEREVGADGRGACRINGRPVTVSVLRQVARSLVNIHGQHDTQTLLEPENHLSFLDAYACTEKELKMYKDIYDKIKRLRKEADSLAVNEAEKLRKQELLKYQIEDIEKARLQKGEEEELSERRTVMQNAQRLLEAASKAYILLYEGTDDEVPSAASLTDMAVSELAGVGRYSAELSALAGRLGGVSSEISDIGACLRDFMDELSFDEEEREETERRWDEIQRLKRKYGGSIDEILAFQEKLVKELEALSFSQERLVQLESEIERLSANLMEMAKTLTEKRTAAAIKLQNAVTRELTFLEMDKVRFEVRLEPLPEPGETGCDGVEFLLSSNPGEPLKPLHKVASGGELSRIMLSIQNVLAENIGVDTLIFDEVDSGVSGRVAGKIALKLKSVSNGRQILCVTHLAQIAAAGHHHLLVEKKSREGKTYTNVCELDFEQRRNELARIMGGLTVTELNLKNADEMLKTAQGGD